MDSLDGNRFPELSHYMSEAKSDVIFVIDGQRVPALKAVMKLKSRVFEAMFSDNFKESKEKEIVIKDTTYEAFKAMVFFIYTDQFIIEDNNDYQLVSEICKLGDRYQLKRLLESIDRHFKTRITSENMEQICGFAFDHRLEKSMNGLKKFMKRNLDQILLTPIEEMERLDEMTHHSWLHTLVSSAKEYRPHRKRYWRSSYD